MHVVDDNAFRDRFDRLVQQLDRGPPLAFDTHGRDQRAAGLHDRLDQLDHGGRIAARPVGEPDHADQRVTLVHRQRQEGRDRRMARRQLARMRIGRHVVDDRRRAPRQRATDDVVEVAELEPAGLHLPIHRPRPGVPGDVGQRDQAQIRPAIRVDEGLTEKAEGALGQRDDRLDHALEDRRVLVVGDEVFLELRHQPQHGFPVRAPVRNPVVGDGGGGVGHGPLSEEAARGGGAAVRADVRHSAPGRFKSR